MPLDPAAVRDIISATAARNRRSRLALAYSGGLDSTVLLDIVAASPPLPLRALHVLHGLQGEQPDWIATVSQNCAERDIPLDMLDAPVRADRGDSVEAAARDARYAALAAVLADDELLLVAQHASDQAETVLLQLLRGAGPAGLSGMPEVAPLGTGVLCRPLLDATSADIVAHADGRGLRWFDDPSNASERFDRNYLRRRVMPALYARWPGAAGTLARAARCQADAERLGTTLAAMDARRLGAAGDRLPVAGLAALDAARQRNLLRFLCRAAGLATPDARRLGALRALATGPTPRGHVRWSGGEARRYRDTVYLLPALPTPPDPDWCARPGKDGRVDLPAEFGVLRFDPAGIAGHDIVCRFRRGGERVRPPGRPGKPFAAWCQHVGLPPWLRTRTPLTFADDRLVAIGERAIAPDWAALSPRWQERPAGL